MPICDVCGNDYDKAFQVTRLGESFTFDSIECAAHLLAPRCRHCDCHILGHGVEEAGMIYCCANCARLDGKASLKDRGGEEPTRRTA